MTFERWSLLSRFWFLFNFRWGQCRISMHRGMCFPIFHHMTLKCWSFIGFGLSGFWLRWWTTYIDKIICKSVLWFRFYNWKNGFCQDFGLRMNIWEIIQCRNWLWQHFASELRMNSKFWKILLKNADTYSWPHWEKKKICASAYSTFTSSILGINFLCS